MKKSMKAEPQLRFGWADSIQWEELPSASQDQIRETLCVLLQRAWRHASEVGDEQR